VSQTPATPGATRHPPIDEIGRNVIANVERLRAAHGLSLWQLSVRLGELGYPMLTTTVHAIVSGRRRTDVGDLVALASALSVSPAELLLPTGMAPDPRIEGHPAVRETRELAARIREVLADSGDPVSAGRLKRALARVRIEVAELLEETTVRTP
jgi:hypothetical protein